MSYDEYWNMDPSLTRAYRKAEEMRMQKANYEMWMTGRYVYDGIMRLCPTLHALKPQKPLPYMEEPYAITEEEYNRRRLRDAKRKQEEMRERMMAFAKAQREKKEKEEQGDE